MHVSIQQSHPSNLFHPSQSMMVVGRDWCNGILTQHARILRPQLHFQALHQIISSISLHAKLSLSFSSLWLGFFVAPFLPSFHTIFFFLVVKALANSSYPNKPKKSPHDLLLFRLPSLAWDSQLVPSQILPTSLSLARFY